ncbi:MAG: N-6 DNA methylase, partial [Rhodobacteraceae bacterium]|nr:N-6 DNA methylase [Paracoccaceae bacterium]
FVKLMFVKLWADKKLRRNHATRDLFRDEHATIMLPREAVLFSEHWVKQRQGEGVENPINDMFIQLRKEIEKDIELRRKKRIFTKNEDLGLRPDTVLDVVKRLEHVDLFGIDEDLNGRLFETFLNATMRGRDLGQFFTPRSVVKMMTEIAELRVTREYQDRVLDGCCGSGGFLIEALTVMRNKVRENSSFSAQEKHDLIERVANDCIYGIDYGKDPPLARIARINMYLHGDGGSRIYYADGLDKSVDDKAMADPEIIQNIGELRSALSDHKFDVVLTNPPFSMKKESKNPSEKRVLEQYSLAKRSKATSTIRPSLRSSEMFLERYWDVLRPGGRLITVIDETLLSSSDFGYVREFIRQRFLIRAIISLPGDTFRRSGSRVKTSVLVLEKKESIEDTQPNWFYFFAEHIGLDDLNTKASEQDITEARQKAEREAQSIIVGFRGYMNGNNATNILGPDRITDRLDLRNCVPMFGRMAESWEAHGVEVKKLSEVVRVVDKPMRPSDHPDELFTLVKVSYSGKCEVEGEKQGQRIRPATMQRIATGQIIFSTIRATDGAVGIVHPELDGALVSGSYTVFMCDEPHDAAYLWSVLRSHELRADMQSLSPGSGRYTTYWPGVGEVLVPWPSDERRKEIGDGLIDLWERERELVRHRQGALAHLEILGVESEESRRRWTVSKAPQ